MGVCGRLAAAGALAVAISIAGAAVLPASPARADTVGAEAQFFAATNRVRAAHGLAALSPSSTLTGVARRWSSYLASSWRLAHNMNLPNEVSVPWTKLGENVGTGSTVPSIQGAFEASPTHFENIVDPAWDRLGVGVIAIRGRIFVTLDFMRSTPVYAGAARPPRLNVVRVSAVTAAAAPAPVTSAAPEPAATTLDASGRTQTSAVVLGASLEQVRGIAAVRAPRRPASDTPLTARRIGLRLLAWLILSAAAAFLFVLVRPTALFAATRHRRVAEQFGRN